MAFMNNPMPPRALPRLPPRAPLRAPLRAPRAAAVAAKPAAAAPASVAVPAAAFTAAAAAAATVGFAAAPPPPAAGPPLARLRLRVASGARAVAVAVAVAAPASGSAGVGCCATASSLPPASPFCACSCDRHAFNKLTLCRRALEGDMGGAAGGGAETGLGAEPLARVVGAAAGAAGTAAVRGFATGEDSAALGSNTPSANIPAAGVGAAAAATLLPPSTATLAPHASQVLTLSVQWAAQCQVHAVCVHPPPPATHRPVVGCATECRTWWQCC